MHRNSHFKITNKPLFAHVFIVFSNLKMICTIISAFNMRQHKTLFMHFKISYRLKPLYFFSPHVSLTSPHSDSCSIQFTAIPSPTQRLNQLSIHLPHKGKTRNPEKVEYFQPPIRLPLSSLR